ncbi:beta-1,6-N-acetylglucosaminyltransferase [Coleofasciculus sp. FACHB-1120]|uniref:beta-1,6-N-acetylglucosaminyltransferase n=1 Tax=Coleofasciculus sp. FACHB-1120 TaxID=2692783 RepID=UPI001682B947|nr:beta-1,6-N-acetylglucosaminyltransferase [Coleofasciculus sp. FACHB-1120]MBD2740763.1 N-acetylglucosaminyltransferase [Coleofasciculus sp. FACHB-1120]
MKVLYLIQSHKNSEQICRLVQTIKRSSSKAQILISHDFNSCQLDVKNLEIQPGVYVIKKNTKGVRGDFSLVQAYLDALEWLFTHKIDFDWLINLSGQDYPTQPLCRFEQFLEETKFDGFLQYSALLSKDSYYGLKESRDRYLYQYWHSGVQFSKWQRGLVKPFRILLNNIQPFIKLDSSYQFSLGIRAYSNPFNKDFIGYGGSYFKILSKNCISYLYEFLKNDETLINYYKKTRNPDESFIQTILVNSGLFNLCNNYKFYIDWTGSRHGHPRTLTSEDYSAIIKRDVYFARKFDMAKDSMILDMLDARVLKESSPVTLSIS